jgi:hypothetical protein
LALFTVLGLTHSIWSHWNSLQYLDSLQQSSFPLFSLSETCFVYSIWNHHNRIY